MSGCTEAQASVSPAGTWGLNPQTGVISRAKAGQPGDVPCPAGTHSGLLSHCPSCSAQLLGDLHPHSALMGFPRVKQNKGRICKVTRSSSSRVHIARLWATRAQLRTAGCRGGRVSGTRAESGCPGSALMGLRPLRGPSIHSHCPLPGTVGHTPGPPCVWCTVHSAPLFEAENGTPTEEASLGCMHKARGCPKGNS